MKNNRNYNIDLIRLTALLSVVSVHFFLNSGYYDVIMSGKKMFIMTAFRSLFMICVPLFITLTGFLMCEKKLSKKYYKRLITVLITYILCSITYSIFCKYYISDSMNLFVFFENILSYRGTPYGWYIEMYIGLFLLIPFLNMIVDNLNSKNEFQIILLTLIIMVSLPGMINIYNLESLDWWANPAKSSDYYKVLPTWWTQLYPILYYFLGSYFKKFSVKVDNKKTVLLICITVLLNSGFSFYRSHNSTFINGGWNDYFSLFTFIQTFLIFILILNLKINIKNDKMKKVLESASSATLGAYLLSYIFDYIFYGILNKRIPNVTDRFIYAPFIVILIYICSLLLSLIVNYIQSFFTRKINNRLHNKV